MLEITNLHVKTDQKEILHGVNLNIEKGAIHAIMGPNGSGKSTLAYAIAGHPNYTIAKGDVLLDKKSLKDLPPDKRSLEGIFLAFQYPQAIPGVRVIDFLRSIYNARSSNERMSVFEFQDLVEKNMKKLDINPDFANRYVNDGFSGGEKKKLEMLQMIMLKPKYVILDETDSGLDIDALKTISKGIKQLKKEIGMGILIITHYQRILDYLVPDYVHIMKNGEIVRSGDANLAKRLEKVGYDKM